MLRQVLTVSAPLLLLSTNANPIDAAITQSQIPSVHPRFINSNQPEMSIVQYIMEKSSTPPLKWSCSKLDDIPQFITHLPISRDPYSSLSTISAILHLQPHR